MYGVQMMMNLSEPDDFVFATGQLHSVKDFVNLAFKHAGIEPEWSGEGLNETARDRKNGDLIVKIDERFYRPGDIKGSCGDASKAERKLNWRAKTDLDAIIEFASPRGEFSTPLRLQSQRIFRSLAESFLSSPLSPRSFGMK